MKKSGILATAAVLAVMFAGPATAQEVFFSPGHTYTGGHQHQVYRDQSYADQAYRDRAWQDSYNRWDDDRTISPGAVAAGVVGGAVGTAAAIATAPFVSEDYARRNGFVCMPGTLFRGEDGLMHICQ